MYPSLSPILAPVGRETCVWICVVSRQMSVRSPFLLIIVMMAVLYQRGDVVPLPVTLQRSPGRAACDTGCLLNQMYFFVSSFSSQCQGGCVKRPVSLLNQMYCLFLYLWVSGRLCEEASSLLTFPRGLCLAATSCGGGVVLYQILIADLHGRVLEVALCPACSCDSVRVCV